MYAHKYGMCLSGYPYIGMYVCTIQCTITIKEGMYFIWYVRYIGLRTQTSMWVAERTSANNYGTGSQHRIMETARSSFSSDNGKNLQFANRVVLRVH